MEASLNPQKDQVPCLELRLPSRWCHLARIQQKPDRKEQISRLQADYHIKTLTYLSNLSLEEAWQPSDYWDTVIEIQKCSLNY